MTVLSDQILITVWWTLGKKWFRAKLIADTLKLNAGGVGSTLRGLSNSGILEVKEEVETRPSSCKGRPAKKERKRVRNYRLSREGLKVVRRLIGVNDRENRKTDTKGS